VYINDLYTVYLVPTADEILAVAARMLRDDGVDALSLRRVAEAVGVTPMALYNHFDNKGALLDALVAEGYRRWEGYLARALGRRTPLGRVREGLRQYREFALDEPRFFELMFLTPRPGIPGAPASLADTPSATFNALAAAAAEALGGSAAAPSDPRETILLLWAAAHGLVALHFTGRFGGDPAAFRRAYDRALGTLLRLLAPAAADAGEDDA
jgi:AcrR family transcriptional regulator